MNRLRGAARLRALALLSRAHLLEFLREPGVVFWAFGFPILLSWALGLAFLSPHPVRAVFLVEPADSAAIRARLPDTALVSLRGAGGPEALRLLRRGEAAGQILLHGGDLLLRADTASQEGATARLLVERASLRAVPAVRVEPPEATTGGYADFLFPGMLALGLLNGCAWGIGFGLMDLRLRKLLRLFAATPLPRLDILLSVALARAATLPVESLLLWGFGTLVFGVAIHGSVCAFLLVAASSVAAFAGIAFLAASRAEQNQAAYGIINALTIPMTICSGVFFAWTRFPHWLHPVIGALPLTLSADALRAVSSEGAGLVQVLPRIAGLWAWGLVCGALGLRWFKWR